jgi:hypothetical protein
LRNTKKAETCLAPERQQEIEARICSRWLWRLVEASWNQTMYCAQKKNREGNKYRCMQVASLSRFSSFFFIFGAVELDGNMEQDMGQATDSVRSTNAKKRTLGFGPLFFSFITVLE